MALYGSPPSYSHLRVFGCLCYPNMTATAKHKLAPRSLPCVFLGYSAHHKGFRCLDTSSNHVIISRHVVFDESTFPFSELSPHPTPQAYDFLEDSTDFVPAPIGPSQTPLSAGSPMAPPAGPSPPVSVPVPTSATGAPSPALPCAAPALPCAALGASSPALPCAAPGASSPALPRAAPGASTSALPRTAPTVPPGFAPRSPAAAPAGPADSSPRRMVQPLPPVQPFDRVYTRRGAPAPPPPPSTGAQPLPKGTVPVLPVVNQHRMVIRAKLGFRQPALFTAAPLSPVPKTFRSALADPNWRAAMEEEHDALLKNHTWDLVPRPPRTNLVTGKWIFKHKLEADGSLERYKARWVLRGFTQRPGVDFDETFSPVVKPATVRTVLSLALSRRWPIHQLDVKNAFLHGTLSETVYCAQPAGFEDTAHPDYVCRLNRSLYGLKQAPRAWYSRFAAYLLSLGFVEAKSDTSLFVYRRGTDTIYLLLYVDDIVLTASSSALLQQTIQALQQEFSMKDLGELHFLGMHVRRHGTGLLLSQRQYMLDILERAGMTECKPCSTPVDTNPKLAADGPPVQDASEFRSLAGALQYLTFTRPDIAYAVQQVCLHMHDPREPHLAALKHILRYIRGTLHLGLLLRPSSQSELTVYSDAD